ncbi:MAG: glycosyltransferase family 9 protein [Candidatus Saganbacteria bacterium]|nr:glycosyltransferase family 9 protein [Candidatus Saganbacteria bacterium]
MAKNSDKILIVLLGAIGDVVMATSILPGLKEKYPEARISWLVGKWSAPVLQNNPYIDEIIIIDDSLIYKKRFFSLLSFVRALRSRKFDLSISLHRSMLMNWIISLVCAKKQVGFDKISFDQDEHKVGRALKVCGLSYGAPNVWLGKEEPEFANKTLKGMETIAINVGGGKNPGITTDRKRWPAESFVALSKKLKMQLLFVGGKSDIKTVEQVVSQLDFPVVNMTGKTSLLELAALLKKSRLLITGDTGPMHIATAVKTPVVAIMGPTNPKQTGPYGEKNVVLYKKLYCSPCFRDNRTFEKCDFDLKCMKDITVEEVLASVNLLLKNN